MKPRMHVILDMAIEEGVKRGWHRAHKHVENPSEESIVDTISDCVMSAITDYFNFEDGDFL
jgi:hypothetical protein